MFCSISGTPAKVPVLSPRSHRVFERSLLESYILENNSDPISNEQLSIEELIPIALDPVNEVGISAIAASQSTAHTSIPSLLSSLQSEWDALALEVFQLRKQLLESKQELSLALYRHDAAVRVAAKAVKERDEARTALQQLAISIGNGDMEEIETDTKAIMPNDNFANWTQRLNESQQKLFQLHKSTKYPTAFQPSDEIILSSTKVADLGTLLASIDISLDDENQSLISSKVSPDGSRVIIVSGEHAGLFDISGSHPELVKTLSYGSSITSFHLSNDQLTIALEDGKIYIEDEVIFEISSSANNKITQILKHPDDDLNLLILVRSTGSYLILDTSAKETIYESEAINSEGSENYINKASIHPDGNLIALGGDDTGDVYIYDISQGKLAITLPSIENGKLVQSIKFANNGYSLFVNHEGVMAVHDLRKNTISASWELDAEKDNLAEVDDSTSLCFTGSSLSRYLKKPKAWKDSVCRVQDVSSSSYSLDSAFLTGSKEIVTVYSDGTVYTHSLSN